MSKKRLSGSGVKVLCDPRCRKHPRPDIVTTRVLRACTRRIEFELKRRANRADSDIEEAPVSSTLASASQSRPLNYVEQWLGTSSKQQADPVDYDDTTMPTWGDFGQSGLRAFDYGDNEDSESAKSNTGLSTGSATLSVLWGPRTGDQLPQTDLGSGSDSDLRSNECIYEISGSVEMHYTSGSGSEADVDTEVDMYPELDDLEYISPIPTRSPSPVLGNNMDPVEPPNANLNLREGEPENPPPPIAVDAERATESDLNNEKDLPEPPDALRAFREWILKMSSTGDLTVEAAESLLKTINTCLEKDLLRCGPEINSSHRLPMTLATLQRQAQQPSELMERYAVCPDFKCQRLRKLSSMDPCKPYFCIKCRKPITKQKITRQRGRRKTTYLHVPVLEYTSCSIRKQLEEILGRPGILDAIRKHREYLRREGKPPGTYEDIQDGELWQNFMKDESKFFDYLYNIGLVLMCDWFQPSTRQGAASYSVGAISLCIANLPPHLRNRPENKILVGVTPGPHEPNVDTINDFLTPMVDELLQLWNEGMTLKVEPGETITSHVALVACACDSPAARKLGGFGGTGSTYPCTACWCSHRELHNFTQDFLRRTRKEHRKAAKAYRRLPNKSQKQKFISTKYEKDKPAGYRDSALLRLPYWDATTMVVVDPMHCLFLGVVDWQFHTIWVDMKHLRPGEELDKLQAMVQSTIRPRHCGRPPGGLGTSAAGSLTSDPLRSLITIDLPLAIPILWDQVDEASVKQRAHNEWALRKQAQEKRKAEAQKGDKITRNATRARQQTEAVAPAQGTSQPQKQARTHYVPAGGKPTQGRLHGEFSGESNDGLIDLNSNPRIETNPLREQGLLSWRYEDAEGILWLSRAIKHLCSRTITSSNIEEGHSALIKYLNMCAEATTHIAAQLRRFGPMHQIWTYSGERLNFTLKNTNSNRHGGGERERTFAVTFHRRRDCISRLSKMSSNKSDPLSEWATYMLQLGHSHMRGTYEADSHNPQENEIMPSVKHKKPIELTQWQKASLGVALARAQPTLAFRCAAWEQGNSPILSTRVYPIREVALNGRIFSMSSLGDSIIKARTVESGEVVERVGEIVDLWQHIQPTDNTSISNTFALVRWYKASTIFAPRPVVLWSESFQDLDIEIYVPNEYLERQAVISTSDIVCHCARMSATLDGEAVWLTIGLERE